MRVALVRTPGELRRGASIGSELPVLLASMAAQEVHRDPEKPRKSACIGSVVGGSTPKRDHECFGGQVIGARRIYPAPEVVANRRIMAIEDDRESFRLPYRSEDLLSIRGGLAHGSSCPHAALKFTRRVGAGPRLPRTKQRWGRAKATPIRRGSAIRVGYPDLEPIAVGDTRILTARIEALGDNQSGSEFHLAARTAVLRGVEVQPSSKDVEPSPSSELRAISHHLGTALVVGRRPEADPSISAGACISGGHADE